MRHKEEKIIMIPQKVGKFLEKAGAKYELIGHRTVYTAFDKAATLRVKLGAVVKVLTLKIGKELALAVIGGDKNLDIEKLQKLAKNEKIAFAKEKTIAENFKGIDPGAIPPFAGLWNVKVFCDKKLLEAPKIIISAGSYEASIIITPAAFKKLNPQMTIANFSALRPKPKAKAIKPKSANKPALKKKRK
ncbi:MAG: YbaK/EbsC family protein [Candidatus Yanofskyibacterium parasiticum]|nr:MAG: YbaK/EbsC family protein [Candidatus Yanofskybacteria bacterium]